MTVASVLERTSGEVATLLDALVLTKVEDDDQREVVRTTFSISSAKGARRASDAPSRSSYVFVWLANGHQHRSLGLAGEAQVNASRIYLAERQMHHDQRFTWLPNNSFERVWLAFSQHGAAHQNLGRAGAAGVAPGV